MYDIRQFKPTLFCLLLLGVSGFALADQSLGLWLLGVGAIGLNAWLVRQGRFKPIPRLVANAATLLSVLFIVHEMMTSGRTPVVVIGRFLVFLQLVKLWEQRGNRDFAQLLVLSLLLMVAASITTASLWFGVLLVVYLFLSLYCCLLFHLKVETDAARGAMPIPPEKLSPNTLRQDQRYLGSSMRRFTGLVAAVSLLFAVAVFIFFPRGSGAGILGPLQMRGASSLTGFSEQVNFQDVARITQNHERVAFVQVWHNDKPVKGDATLLLRGLTLDGYHRSRQLGGGWEWTRSLPADEGLIADVDRPVTMPANGPDRWRQHVTLWPTRTSVLFALAGPVEFLPSYPLKVRYSPYDGALETGDPLIEKITYDVVSTGSLGQGGGEMSPLLPAALLRERFPKIFEFARRPEVSGSDARGPLADRRMLQGDASPLDETIARNIETYLRKNFSYTLDLTDEGSLRGREPIELFLYDWKRGHCEYFAGAMTLMCQTLGMQARMAIGFKAGPEEYNNFSGLYTVYQSDAHAWVEVKTPGGWKTFDPTSSQEYNPGAVTGMFTRARHLIEYVEYTYANAVIAYDAQNRDTLIGSMEAGLTSTATRGAQAAGKVRQFFEESRTFWHVSTLVLSGILLVAIAVMAGAFGWFLWERWRLRRRAARIGIESLPEAEQMQLARQLGFYDDLLRLLDRHRINRPPNYTPLEFSRSLSFLPSDAYDTVQRLTALYYKVRYGGVRLPHARRRRLDTVLDQLTRGLSAPPSRPG